MTDSSTQVSDDGDSRKYFFQMLNIIDDLLDLDPYEYRLYAKYKRIAGEDSHCTRSNARLAKECKMGVTKLKEAKARLALPFKALGGKPLIYVTPRTTDKGDPDTDNITIVDLWLENMSYLAKVKAERDKKQNIGGSPGDRGVGRDTTGGGSPGDHKEEPFKKNPLEEEFVANAPVGSSPYKILVKGKGEIELMITKDDLYLRASSNRTDWKIEEIEYAWSALASYDGIVYDWWRFIEGTVEKYRNSLKSKRAAGESVANSYKQKPKAKGNGKCKQTTSQEQKNINADSSESDSEEQPLQERVSIAELLKRSRAG